MPLNIPESSNQKGGTPGKPAPVPEQPSRGSAAKILLWIFAIVVLASVLFLLVQYGIIPGGKGTSGRPSPADTPAGDTAIPRSAPTDTAKAPVRGALPGSTKGDSERAAELRKRLAGAGGDYTIFISAFSAPADAEELSGRWGRAGYPSFVQHSGGWYRVALGRYISVEAARDDAEKLRQALEEGYWIGAAGAE